MLDDDDREILAIVTGLTASSGEPLRTFFQADDLDALVTRCGLKVADHADRLDLTPTVLR